MIYNTLAHYYDALVKDEEASREWVSWIENELAPCDCLELACGSGEITEMLAKKGYTMTALDLSEEMVKQAKSKNLEGSIQFLVPNIVRPKSTVSDFGRKRSKKKLRWRKTTRPSMLPPVVSPPEGALSLAGFFLASSMSRVLCSQTPRRSGAGSFGTGYAPRRGCARRNGS